MKKTIEVQKAELQARLKKLEQKEVAASAEAREKSVRIFLKLGEAAAKKNKVDLSKVDPEKLKVIFQKVFSELAYLEDAKPADSVSL